MLDKLLRYGVVGKILGPEPKGTILDVGAGPQGLGAVLPYRFVGVDPWYPEPPIPQQTAVRASGTALPFADRSFDYVLAIEVLEHIPPEQRAQVVAEMCRVARRSVIITHPYGRIARAMDHFLNGFYRLLGVLKVQKPWWLVEHLQNPYPDPRRYLPHARDSLRVRIGGQENAFLHPLIAFFGNLKVVQRGSARSHARHPGRLSRWMRLANFPPYCRRVVIIERQDSVKTEQPAR